MRNRLLVATVLAVALVGCEENPQAGAERACAVFVDVMLETAFKSPEVPESARPAAERAGSDLCDCRTKGIAALDGVTLEDKSAYFRDGMQSTGISEQGRPLLQAAHDACGEAFGKAWAAALDEHKPDS